MFNLDLADEDFKVAIIINVFRVLKNTMFKELNKNPCFTPYGNINSK